MKRGIVKAIIYGLAVFAYCTHMPPSYWWPFVQRMQCPLLLVMFEDKY